MAKTDGFCNRAEAYEAHDNVPLSPAQGDTIGDLILRRYSRRAVLRGTLGAAAGAALFGPSLLAGAAARADDAPDRFAFAEIAAGVDGTHHIAEGYRADVLLRWGDPLFPDSPRFDPLRQSVEAHPRRIDAFGTGERKRGGTIGPNRVGQDIQSRDLDKHGGVANHRHAQPVAGNRGVGH